ncbi:MAG: transposase [Candidatus Omnitrophica bacterium]|nr:transposase [Candidatus Omnitrophota bacterium]
MSTYPREKLLFYPAKFNLYNVIFQHLDLSLIKEQIPKTGRRPFSRRTICRALIYKNLKAIQTLSELAFELSTNLGISYVLGFDKQPPSRHRFVEFLHKVPNQLLQEIRRQQIKTLIGLSVISGKYLSIDSTPVIAWVKQNNPKMFVEGKFDKTKFPQGDPDARLGFMMLQKYTKHTKEQQLELFKPPDIKDKGNKRIICFWGYRNHVIFDSLSELPVFELTKPANVFDSKVTVLAFKELKKNFKFKPKGILGDAAHDTNAIRKYIRKTLKTKDFIPINPRATKQDIKFTKHNTRVCVAGFEMYPWGSFKDRGRTRKKFVCPITHLKRFAKKHNHQCPMNHPKFVKGGCYAYVRIDSDDYRTRSIDPKSEFFKKTYKLQSGSERGFSRLLTFYMQRPMLTGINAVANQCTLAHITILAIAIAVAKSKQKEKIRFIRGLLRDLLQK